MSHRTIHNATNPLPPPPASSSLNPNPSHRPSPTGYSISTTFSSTLPLPPPPTKVHRTWHAVYIHSAKCDGCHTKKHKVLQRCDGCTLQYCQSCMSKAAENGHEYDESKLDWDPSQKSPTYRDRSSMKRKRQRGEKLPPKSRLGGFVVGDDEVEYYEEGAEEDDSWGRSVSQESRRTVSASASTSVSSRGSRGGSYRGTARPTERLLSEVEKYQPQVGMPPLRSIVPNSDELQAYGTSYAGSGPDPEYGRYFNQDMTVGDEDSSSTSLHPNKRQRKTSPILNRSVLSHPLQDKRVNNQVFKGLRSIRTQPSASSTMARPINKIQSPINPQKQPASSASVGSSSRRESQQQQQEAIPQPTRSTIRRAASMLTLDSSFEEATDAVMKAQEDEYNLPRRRRQFEEYCKDRWLNEPLLKQLRKEGQNGEAEELWLASKAALYAAYRLDDEFGRDVL